VGHSGNDPALAGRLRACRIEGEGRDTVQPRLQRQEVVFKARAVTDFLELPWAESMLRPAERAQAKGYISTPSYAQVTQPVNQKSVDRWKRYEKYFAGALPPLEPYLARWGYGRADVNSR